VLLVVERKEEEGGGRGRKDRDDDGREDGEGKALGGVFLCGGGSRCCDPGDVTMVDRREGCVPVCGWTGTYERNR
jgi:hypothetical protein